MQKTLPWRQIGLGAAALAALSAFLPWVSVVSAFGSLSFNGMSVPMEAGTSGMGDGVIALGLAAAVAIAFYLHRKMVGALISVVLFALGVWKVQQLSTIMESQSNEFAFATVGVGLWLLIGASLVAALAGNARWEMSPLPEPATEPDVEA